MNGQVEELGGASKPLKEGSATSPKPGEMTRRQRVQATVDGRMFTTVMTIATVYALFGDDMRIAWFPKDADILFVVFSSIAFFLFAQELLLQCYAKPGYLGMPRCKRENLVCNRKEWRILNLFSIGSFYFWLDVIATASLVPEIPWMLSSDTDEVSTTASGDDGISTARAGRASRAGARAGRVFRVVRLVRLVRVVKVYKYWKDSRQRKQQEMELEAEIEKALAAGNHAKVVDLKQQAAHIVTQEPAEKDKESQVGAALSDITTRRVIVGLLVLLVCIPLMTPQHTDTSNSALTTMTHGFSVAAVQDPARNGGALSYMVETLKTTKPSLVYLQLNTTAVVNNVVEIGTLRTTELDKLKVEASTISGVELHGATFATEAWFSVKEKEELTAVWSLVLTVFVIIVLAVSAMLFSHDANVLVLAPIKRLVQVVTEISENPLKPPARTNFKEFREDHETTLLLDTITKIGGLLRVGFGEAGAAVIAVNLNDAAELDPVKKGRKINAIFGFCDIRKFTDTTECLQVEVMLFVNRMADVVHGFTVQHKGAANKNIGDAFLLAWKFNEDTTEHTIRDQSWRTQGVAVPEHVRLADGALMAFLKIIAQAERSDFVSAPDQISHEARKRLLASFHPGEKEPPRIWHKVRMGFGLHWGWAIEGAIGSAMKIDASYLSSNVKMAERLEGGTKTYGVPILFTQDFYSVLSNAAQSYVRRVDHLNMPALTEPMDLYTFDCNMDADFVTHMLRRHHHRSTRSRGTSQADSTGGLRHRPTGGAGASAGAGAGAGAGSGAGAGAGGGHAMRSQQSASSGRGQGHGAAVAGGGETPLWQLPHKYDENEWHLHPDLRKMQEDYSTPEFREEYELGLGLFLGTVGCKGTRMVRRLPDGTLVPIGFDASNPAASPLGAGIGAGAGAGAGAGGFGAIAARRLSLRTGSAFDVESTDGIIEVIIPDWASARAQLERVRTMMDPTGKRTDGPSNFLLSIMKETNYIPPEDWQGIHFVDV